MVFMWHELLMNFVSMFYHFFVPALERELITHTLV